MRTNGWNYLIKLKLGRQFYGGLEILLTKSLHLIRKLSINSQDINLTHKKIFATDLTLNQLSHIMYSFLLITTFTTIIMDNNICVSFKVDV
jgi:hypothetical protein